MKSKIWLFAVVLSGALLLHAADVTGKWSAQVPSRGGELRDTTFVFKQDGAKLTGTMTGPQGDIPIQNGKVEGDTISFDTTMNFGGNEVKILYKGTVSGDEIKFKRERDGSGQAREFTAKRATT